MCSRTLCQQDRAYPEPWRRSDSSIVEPPLPEAACNPLHKRELIAAFFDSLDTDSNRKLSFDEIKATMLRLYEVLGQHGRGAVTLSWSTFTNLDKDHDGSLNFEECGDFLGKVVSALDEHASEHASAEGRDIVGTLFAQFDGDGDSRLSPNEFFASLGGRSDSTAQGEFDKIDRDRDGYIDAKEAKALLENVQLTVKEKDEV